MIFGLLLHIRKISEKIAHLQLTSNTSIQLFCTGNHGGIKNVEQVFGTTPSSRSVSYSLALVFINLPSKQINPPLIKADLLLH